MNTSGDNSGEAAWPPLQSQSGRRLSCKEEREVERCELKRGGSLRVHLTSDHLSLPARTTLTDIQREDGRSEISLESSINAMEEKPECSGKRTEQLGLDNNFSEIASLSQRPEDGENPHKKNLTKHLKRSSSRKQKERTLINDEFTEFSQFGSRFMLNQPEEKNKKTNFVEHLQENKIFNKVATTVLNTCQKHYKKRTTPPDQQNTYRRESARQGRTLLEEGGERE